MKSNKATVQTFQSTVSQLVYTMLATQPKIAYTINMLVRHKTLLSYVMVFVVCDYFIP